MAPGTRWLSASLTSTAPATTTTAVIIQPARWTPERWLTRPGVNPNGKKAIHVSVPTPDATLERTLDGVLVGEEVPAGQHEGGESQTRLPGGGGNPAKGRSVERPAVIGANPATFVHSPGRGATLMSRGPSHHSGGPR